jgi:hypothetical protein
MRATILAKRGSTRKGSKSGSILIHNERNVLVVLGQKLLDDLPAALVVPTGEDLDIDRCVRRVNGTLEKCQPGIVPPISPPRITRLCTSGDDP